MKRFFRFFFYFLSFLVILATAAYFVWFRNPYNHDLTLNPRKVFSTDQKSYLIKNANIIDVENGRVKPNKVLFIDNGFIEKIYDEEAPDSLKELYKVIDIENRFILPGLYDMHAHLNSGGLLPVDSTIRKSALEQFLKYGVTTVFTLGGHGFHEDVTLSLKQQEADYKIVSPRIFATGNILTVADGYPIPFMPQIMGVPMEEINLENAGILTIDSTSDLLSILASKKAKGLNGVKIMVESGPGKMNNPRMPKEQVEEIVKAAAQYDLPVFAHVTKKDDMLDAVEAGVDAIVHTVADPQLLQEQSLFEFMRDNNVLYIPTLSMAHRKRILANPEMLEDTFLLNRSSRKTTRSLENTIIRTLANKQMGGYNKVEVQKNETNFLAMHKAGIPVVMGTDAGNLTVIPGYSAHLEMEFMAMAGMSNEDILRSATIIPAQFLKESAQSGTIDQGKRASLLILDKNPLEDIKNTRSIFKVMHKGYWIE